MTTQEQQRRASIFMEVERLAAEHGLTVVERAQGHLRILGGLVTVSYWPFSKKRTVYVDQTRRGKAYVSPEEAVRMAMKAPPMDRTDKRRPQLKRHKLRMLKKDPRCFWCGLELTEETATVDHEIPRSRGGLDNANNYVLACEPCGSRKGNNVQRRKKHVAP